MLVQLVRMSSDTENSFTAEAEEKNNPYGFLDKETSFGMSRGNSYFPKSDFGLKLVDFVEAKLHTGYCCLITRQFDKQKRYDKYDTH